MTTGTMIGIGIGVPLAAASVPVIIHLINLTRYRKVDWAAMGFLLAAYKKTRKRLQMESLIMLLLRVCAIVLLALAFFPFAAEQVKAWFSEGLGLGRVAFSANAPLHLVVVLDNSASMAYTQEGQTSFERAKKYGLGVVDGLTQGRDRVSIVRLSDIYVPRGIGGSAISEEEQAKSRRRRVGQSANLDIETARRQLAETTVAAVDTNMLVALREAYRLMDVTPATDAAALVVVSDFAGSGWQELMKNGAQTGEFRDVMVKINERMAKTGGAPVFYDAGFDEAQNLAITSLSCDDRVIGDGMETRINVEVANFSRGGEIKNISLVYRVDGREAKPAGGKVQLAAGQRNGDIQIVLKPEDLKLINEREKKTGASRHIEVEIVEPDGLKSDNRRNLVINVVPDVPILVVNGVADKNPRLDETIYLETALAISESNWITASSGSPSARSNSSWLSEPGAPVLLRICHTVWSGPVEFMISRQRTISRAEAIVASPTSMTTLARSITLRSCAPAQCGRSTRTKRWRGCSLAISSSAASSFVMIVSVSGSSEASTERRSVTLVTARARRRSSTRSGCSSASRSAWLGSTSSWSATSPLCRSRSSNATWRLRPSARCHAVFTATVEVPTPPRTPNTATTLPVWAADAASPAAVPAMTFWQARASSSGTMGLKKYSATPRFLSER